MKCRTLLTSALREGGRDKPQLKLVLAAVLYTHMYMYVQIMVFSKSYSGLVLVMVRISVSLYPIKPKQVALDRAQWRKNDSCS